MLKNSTATPSQTRVVSDLASIRAQTAVWRKQGLRIALVPTMGFLHQGHAALIRTARLSCDKVVVSIFVNPTQFGPNEDLDHYPRDLEGDTLLCTQEGVNVVFTPTVADIYPQPNATQISVAGLGERLCGASRPGHFDGVCLVVAKLLQIVQPDQAFFGEKDAQQLAIVRRMVMDLNIPVEIVGCPIVRAPGGLALSSRNQYLSAQELNDAERLQQALQLGRSAILAGERSSPPLLGLMQQHIQASLLKPPPRIDYLQIVDAQNLQALPEIKGEVLLLLAVFYRKTRLIDNLRVLAPTTNSVTPTKSIRAQQAD